MRDLGDLHGKLSRPDLYSALSLERHPSSRRAPETDTSELLADRGLVLDPSRHSPRDDRIRLCHHPDTSGSDPPASDGSDWLAASILAPRERSDFRCRFRLDPSTSRSYGTRVSSPVPSNELQTDMIDKCIRLVRHDQ